VPSGNSDYNGVPFLKAYWAQGTSWTDYQVLGTGCSFEDSPSSCTHLGFFVQDGPTDKVRFEWGTRDGVAPASRVDPYVILAYGK